MFYIYNMRLGNNYFLYNNFDYISKYIISNFNDKI